MEIKVNGRTIKLLLCDITELTVDAIVNAANTRLWMGGGVAGAIRRKGGPEIQKECNNIGGTFVGSAVITSGGNLNAKYVIHAVGPRMGEGDEDVKLKNATINSLKLADKYKLKTIAFPAISTGVFGFPMDRCAKIMLSTTMEYLKEDTQIKKVIFCLYDKKAFDTFKQPLAKKLEVK
ncbi:MAG: macro domain-containing protein [bacterium]|nr:macro domain-containing protein [bacterium]